MRISSVGGHAYRKQEAIRVSFETYREDALQALRERCRSSPAFRRLLEAAAYDLVRRGRPEPVLTGNTPGAERALVKAVYALSEIHRAKVPEGKAAVWCYLTPRPQKAGSGKRLQVLTPVSRLEALAIMHSEATVDGFKVRKLLGYAPNISWRAAARLNRVHGPPSFYLVEASEERRDDAYDLDPNENEHFRDDRGWYDAAGVLQPCQQREPQGWEDAYASRLEAWNKTHSRDFAPSGRIVFYPAPAAEMINRGLERTKVAWRIDHHGVSTLLRYRDERRARQRELEQLTSRQQAFRQLPDAPLYHADLTKAQQNLLEHEHLVTLQRRVELDADEAEVLACAERDVPETILELLERQVEEATGKAPRGLIAALARERLNARQHAERNRRYVDGLAALEAASRCETA